jgi:hypothetical protein
MIQIYYTRRCLAIFEISLVESLGAGQPIISSSASLSNTAFVTVLGSFWETALIVEAGLTGDYVPARV